MTKYQRWQDQIIERARERGYGDEVHHIRPVSLGGTNAPENLVRLTYREHFLVHWLLTKIHTSGLARRKMQLALISMSYETVPWIERKRTVLPWQKRVCRRTASAVKSLVEGDLKKLPKIKGWTRRYDELRFMATEFMHSREGHQQLTR